MNESIEVEVPGRICLFGDKVDLLGKPVIAATVNIMMYVKITKRNDDIIEFYSENLNCEKKFHLNDEPDFNHPLKYWSAIVARLKSKIGGFSATVKSDIPIGSGLSTSAAICVSLIRGLNELYTLDMDAGEIAELAYVCEHDDLEISCGRMDQYSIAFGGVVFIETGDIPKVTKLPVKSLPIVVADSQEERKAATVLNRIRKNIDANDPVVLKAFKEVERIVYEGKEALLKGDYRKIGELMTQQQEQENILQAATKKLNTLCDASIEAGAYGAKQMGAGGGGCMEAICPGKEKEVQKAIEVAGGKSWIFDIYHYNEDRAELKSDTMLNGRKAQL